jgi:hypothetical protein
MLASVICTFLIIQSGHLTRNYVNFAGLEILRVLTLKTSILRGVTLCSLIKKYQHSRIICCGLGLSFAALKTFDITGKQDYRAH